MGPSAVSHLNVRVLLAANGHLRRQKASPYDSRASFSSLHLPIGCGAITQTFSIDKALDQSPVLGSGRRVISLYQASFGDPEWTCKPMTPVCSITSFGSV